MRLVQTTQTTKKYPKKKKARYRSYVVLAVSLFGVLIFQLFRPLPAPTASFTLPEPAGAATTKLVWPDSGQASLSADGHGSLGLFGDQKPIATASIAKVITALCVLEKHPLKPGETGPDIPINAVDVSFYQAELEQNGSNLPVYEGEKLSEYQAIQALMIPSANNISNTLALWAFGSMENYRKYATNYLAGHGLINTRIGSDASGYSDSTVSTAEDLAKLGEIAQDSPVLMEIAGQKSAIFPEIGVLYNYNTALGMYGINGLKTGNNNANPGALLFSAEVPVNDKVVAISGSVLGASSLAEAIDDSKALVSSTSSNFENYTFVTAGQRIGVLRTNWGTQTDIFSEKELSFVHWKGYSMSVKKNVEGSLRYNHVGSIGSVSVQSGEERANVNAITKHSPAGPSLWWRLTRL